MGNGAADARALVREAARQTGEVRDLYEAGPRSQILDPGLRPRVKNALENQRSALEYLAHVSATVENEAIATVENEATCLSFR